jgi:hypothetical protein
VRFVAESPGDLQVSVRYYRRLASEVTEGLQFTQNWPFFQTKSNVAVEQVFIAAWLDEHKRIRHSVQGSSSSIDASLGISAARPQGSNPSIENKDPSTSECNVLPDRKCSQRSKIASADFWTGQFRVDRNECQ